MKKNRKISYWYKGYYRPYANLALGGGIPQLKKYIFKKTKKIEIYIFNITILFLFKAVKQPSTFVYSTR